MKTYWIGRRPASDIVVDDGSVSNLHAELVETDDGEYYLTDCNSTNGTYYQQQGQWKRIRQTFVAIDDPLKLGEVRTTVRQLLKGKRARQRTGQEGYSEYYKRNPGTGEMERC